MTEDAARAFAFMRRGDMAGSREEPFRYGVAIFDDELRERWDSNYLLVERSPDSAEELTDEAERVQGAAGLRHRAILFPDAEAGAPFEPAYLDAGWQVHRGVVMVARRKPNRAPPPADVREVDQTALRPGRTRLILTYPWGTEAVARTLLAAKPAIAARVRARFFAAFVGGEPASWTDLYSDGARAQIEDVATLPEHRGRGLATAVVLHALGAARAEGCDFVFLVADSLDWPRHLYGKLGFDAVGEYVKFVRPG